MAKVLNPTQLIRNDIVEKRITCFDIKEFSTLGKIADGMFSSISKLEWKNYGMSVVLKSIKTNINPSELLFLRKVSFHPNIISFYGLIEGLLSNINAVLHKL
ncbi:14466_t:CDS:2 [Gigaspora margarita]|uniref:14466_t:CDS:1 n=1 Tax=Gigaspora margarita TaxID=4874 RepID=A0ABN7UPZ1_GIGMA|nr:14466_t:CDS:2 [Gigaspora margarita]